VAGAAVWQASRRGRGAGTYIPVEMAQRGAGVNRAELTAIEHAARDERHIPLTVATDSLVSIYQLGRFIRSPHAFSTHPQRGTLLAISLSLLARAKLGLCTEIVKVRAHSGCPGNVMADQVASGRRAPVSVEETESRAAHPPRWIWQQDAATQTWQPLANLRGAMNKAIPRTHRMGLANVGSCYYDAYKTVAVHSHRSSHCFLRSPNCDWATTRLALKYRGGLIYTNKLAARYGRSDVSACPLCGLDDSQSHLLGGCRDTVLSGMYNNRHNDAVRLVAQALMKKYPVPCIVQSGVGPVPPESPELPTQDDCSQGGPTQGGLTPEEDSDTTGSVDARQPRPPAAIPAMLVDWGRDKPRVPDLTLALPDGSLARPGAAHVVELKFGQDTRLEDKRAEAASILNVIAGAVNRAHPSCTVHTHLLLVGVGGRIPTSTHTALVLAGLTHTEATRLCNRLNLHAVATLAAIVRTRRQLERQLHRGGVG